MNKSKYVISSRDYEYARQLLRLIPISEETKEKRRRPRSEETKEKIRKTLSGHKHSKETLELIAINTKKGMTAEVVEKMINNRKDFNGENNPFYGKIHSEESKKKMSYSHTGKKRGSYKKRKDAK